MRETGAHSHENREEETARAAGDANPRGAHGVGRDGNGAREGGEGGGRRAGWSAPPRRRPLGALTRRATSATNTPKIARSSRSSRVMRSAFARERGPEALALRDAPATVFGTRVAVSSLVRDGRPRRRRATGLGRALVPSFDGALEPSFRGCLLLARRVRVRVSSPVAPRAFGSSSSRAADYHTHVVKPGENLSYIAQDFATSIPRSARRTACVTPTETSSTRARRSACPSPPTTAA